MGVGQGTAWAWLEMEPGSEWEPDQACQLLRMLKVLVYPEVNADTQKVYQ